MGSGLFLLIELEIVGFWRERKMERDDLLCGWMCLCMDHHRHFFLE